MTLPLVAVALFALLTRTNPRAAREPDHEAVGDHALTVTGHGSTFEATAATISAPRDSVVMVDEPPKNIPDSPEDFLTSSSAAKDSESAHSQTVNYSPSASSSNDFTRCPPAWDSDHTYSEGELVSVAAAKMYRCKSQPYTSECRMCIIFYSNTA